MFSYLLLSLSDVMSDAIDIFVAAVDDACNIIKEITVWF